MARQKKQVKVKEPVRIRYDELKDGRRSLFLDTYHDGKRSIKYLKLYLVPETDMASRILNENTMTQANEIKAEKILEITNKTAGITDQSHKAQKLLFTDWMKLYCEHVAETKSTSACNWIRRVTEELEQYDNTMTLAEVDRDFIMGFLDRLLSRTAYTRDHASLARNTVFGFLAYIRSALNYAVKENLIQTSPFRGIKKNMLAGTETKREYLTIDEVKSLIETPCRRPDMKAAFLFSCFCGLRIMDIKLLKWKHISKSGNRWQIEITQYKTGIQLYLPLNMSARKWMPEQGDAGPEDLVFPTLSIWYKHVLMDWAKDAGIAKKFSFHVARHTFATLCLTAGIDIYTTSQLLGHASIRHTQRYAKIIDSKRVSAVSMLYTAFIE